MYASKNFSICEGDTLIDGSVDTYGVVTSPNYPNWVSGKRCDARIVAPEGKVIRVLITDLNLEEPEGRRYKLIITSQAFC